MAVNKVEYSDAVLIDLTADTVNPNNLLSGEIAHNKAGEKIEGAVITHDVVNNLSSTSSSDALSANQGRVLNTKKVDKSGGTISGTLVLSKTQNASGTEDNRPALIIGSISGKHLEFDANGIMAKSDGVTPSMLAINNDGGTVLINNKSIALDATRKGSAINPVYTDADGFVQPCTYTLEKSVPKNAVFTDTVYDDAEIKNSITKLDSNLNSEISRAKETEEILKSRVDIIASLPEGSTTADAELLDIRVKADGTTATSAGNAVREQVSELKSDLSDISVPSGINLFNPYTLQEGYTINGTTGELQPSPQWSVSDFIELESGKKYFVKIFEYTGTVEVRYAVYNSSKSFVKRVIGKNGELVKFLTASNTNKYIRLIIANSSNPTGNCLKISVTKSDIEPIEFIGYFTAEDKTARNAIFSKSEFDTPIWSEGYMSYSTAKEDFIVTATNQFYHSDFLTVESGRSVLIKNCAKVGYAYCFFADENKKYIGKVESTTTSSEYTSKLLDDPIPAGARYIILNCTANQHSANSMSIEYYDGVKTTESELSYKIQTIEKNYGGKVYEPLKSVKMQAPIITFIDDDTSSVEFVQAYHDVCVRNGVRGNYAVITFRMDDTQPNHAEIKEKLLSYEEEGFGMLYHCDYQGQYYRNEVAYRDMVQAEKNFVAGLRKMRNIGFTDYMYWVSPYGVHDADMQNMAKRHGLKCLMSTANKNHNKYTDSNRYYMKRCALNPTDAGYSTTLAELKGNIDACANEHGWIIVTTHFNESGWYNDNNTQRFDEICTYARNKGFVFKPFAEAFTDFKKVYDLNEIYV